MFHHVTVLKQEAVDGLDVKPDGIYVDCTLGGAGHSALIASQLGPKGRLIAIDQDDWALENAKERLALYMERVTLVKNNFQSLGLVLDELGIDKVDGVLYDLGVSSPQLDEAERGFSYNQDAALDMRMDREHNLLTAYEIVNEWPAEEITRILFEYGEEKFAKRITNKIVEQRTISPIETTVQLSELIKAGIPAAARRTGGHPAKRSFQALRIAVNDELGVFEDSLLIAISRLKKEGRISVITFHSLEDRICKQVFARYIEKCTCPPDFPVCVCGRKSILKLVNRKPIVASEVELTANPRSRSAKLRIAEKAVE
jgi:16S rRNA (cytosine1402-N4)-methyltransferase